MCCFFVSVLDRANCAMPLRLCRRELCVILSLHKADEAVVQVLLPLGVLESVHQEVDVDPLPANGRLLRRSTTPALFSRSATLSFTRLPGCSTSCSCRVALMKDSQACCPHSRRRGLFPFWWTGRTSPGRPPRPSPPPSAGPGISWESGRWSAWACPSKGACRPCTESRKRSPPPEMCSTMAVLCRTAQRTQVAGARWRRKTPRTAACTSRSSRTGRAQTARRSGR